MSDAINWDLMKKWSKALRSGKYKQGNGSLSDDTRYCCLGVLCEVLEIKKTFNKMQNVVEFEGEVGLLPGSAMDQTGLSSSGLYLNKQFTTMNDHDELSFDEIADLIDIAVMDEDYLEQRV